MITPIAAPTWARTPRRRRWLLLGPVAGVVASAVTFSVALLVATSGSNGAATAASGPRTGARTTAATVEPSGSLSLVAYSTPQPAFAALITAFQATKAGKSVTFTQSYGASGTQATAVIDGLPADVVDFSTGLDMDKVVEAGDVAATWDKGPTKGIVTDSIVSFIVRKGNPLHIKTWADLVKPGVAVITPNPFSSGSAKWNLMAAYGAELAQGKTKSQALAYLSELLQHAASQPSSGSTALQAFLSGQGDVLLDYEDDALYAQRQGEPISIVTPPQTILIQNPIAVTTHSTNPTAAKAFEKYLLSPAGQKIWGQQGYRPVLASVAKQFEFPQPKKLFTITHLGGWSKVNTAFFDPTTGSVAKIEQGLGVSTAKT